jgi:DNA-binding NtrC family response regulator
LKANYPHIHVFLFSGQPDASALLDQAQQKGYSFEVMAKPVHPDVILALVAKALHSDAKQ